MAQTIVLRDQNSLRSVFDAIHDLPLGAKYKVEIKRHQSNRTLAQNALMWLWYGEIQQHLERHLGEVHDTETIHEWMVGKLVPRELCHILGDYVVRRKSTRNMKVSEMTEYLEGLEWYCSDSLGLALPRPDDLYWEAMGFTRPERDQLQRTKEEAASCV